MPQSLKLAALAIVSTAFALSIAELGVRATGAERLYINLEQLHFWKHDPLLGWAHEPGKEGGFEKSSTFSTHVRVNSKGLRDSEHDYERSGDAKRILVLGDSFAWGFGVDYAERFSEFLESSLGVEVINAAISGFSTDQQLLWLRNEGVKYDFDLLLLVFCGNDDHDNHRLRHYIVYNKPRFERDGDSLALRGVPVPEPPRHLRLERFLRQRSSLANLLFYQTRVLYGRLVQRFDLALAFHTRILRQPDPSWVSWLNQDPPFALTRQLIKEMQDIANARGAGFMIASTPRYWMDVTPSGAGGTYEDLMQHLRADGFALLDVETRPGWDRSAMAIPGDGHWNQAGHEFVANELHDFIEKYELLSGGAATETVRGSARRAAQH